MLNLGRDFINLEDRDDQGRTILLEFLHLADGEFKLSNLRLLLANGADVQARDFQGNSGLHLCFQTYWRSFQELEHLETLVILIQAGADIYARNSNGESVPDVARKHVYQVEHCSYTDDLWATALSKCGFDPADFYGEYPIEAIYCSYYTPSDREMLMEEGIVKVPNPRGEVQSSPSSTGVTYHEMRLPASSVQGHLDAEPHGSSMNTSCEDISYEIPIQLPSLPSYIEDVTPVANRADELHLASLTGGGSSPQYDCTRGKRLSSWIMDDNELLEANPWS